MGDNLFDDWIVEAHDPNGHADLVEDTSASSHSEDFDLLSEDEDSDQPNIGKKRPLTDNDDSEAQPLSKKAQKIQALKARKKAKKAQMTNGISSMEETIISQEDAARHLWANCKINLGPKLTEIEVLNSWIKPNDMACVEAFGQHSVNKLPGFIKATVPNWREITRSTKNGSNNMNFKKGSPPIIIICSGARRCVEIIKVLAIFHCQVLKLFAKHLKPAEQAKMLGRYFPIAVGTPGRILKLASEGPLSLDSTQLVVIDMWRNIKARNILDMSGVADDFFDFFRLYARPQLISSPGAGNLRLGLY